MTGSSSEIAKSRILGEKPVYLLQVSKRPGCHCQGHRRTSPTAICLPSGLKDTQLTDLVLVFRIPFPGEPAPSILGLGEARETEAGSPSEALGRLRKSGVVGVELASCEAEFAEANGSGTARNTFCLTRNSESTNETTAADPAHVAKQPKSARQANPLEPEVALDPMTRTGNSLTLEEEDLLSCGVRAGVVVSVASSSALRSVSDFAAIAAVRAPGSNHIRGYKVVAGLVRSGGSFHTAHKRDCPSYLTCLFTYMFFWPPQDMHLGFCRGDPCKRKVRAPRRAGVPRTTTQEPTSGVTQIGCQIHTVCITEKRHFHELKVVCKNQCKG